MTVSDAPLAPTATTGANASAPIVLYGCQTCAASTALISAGVNAGTEPSSPCARAHRKTRRPPRFGRLSDDHVDPLPSPDGVRRRSGSRHRAVMGTRTSGFYRHDLDGLRGIAIVLVAVFHVWFGRVSGGVDVFLALSGFFFGGRLLRAALTPGSSLSPVPEVTRLVRRLLPALVVVLAASAVLTILVQPETRWETFADQSLASLGYYQNWELANTASNYLRAGEAVSPLQHIWSMSVQGQFYIAFLALIFGFAFILRRLLAQARPDRADRPAQRTDDRVVRLRDHRARRRPGRRVLQQLRPRLGAAARRPGRRAGAVRPVADVAAFHRASWHSRRSCRAARSSTASRSSPVRGRSCPSARRCCSSSAAPTGWPTRTSTAGCPP